MLPTVAKVATFFQIQSSGFGTNYMYIWNWLQQNWSFTKDNIAKICNIWTKNILKKK